MRGTYCKVILTELSKAFKLPTEAQKKAGNYKKEHTSYDSLQISIENPKGSIRSGVSKSGKEWQTEMQDHYGYIKGVVGKDKDQLDCFLSETPIKNAPVFVVNQVNPTTNKFDEHKVMLGYADKSAAEKAYLRNYEKGWKGLGDIVQLPMKVFKERIASKEVFEALTFNSVRNLV